MKLEFIWVEGVGPADLFGIYEKHHLLSGLMRIRPDMFSQLSTVARLGGIFNGDEPVAWMVETPIGEPGVLDIAIISEGREVDFTRADLEDVASLLHHHWFDEMGAVRVQAFPPIARKRSMRILRFLGFREETKMAGLRDATNLGKRFEPLAAMGLVASDIARMRERKEFAGVVNGE